MGVPSQTVALGNQDGWTDGWTDDGWKDGCVGGWVVGRWIPQEQGSYSQYEKPLDSKVSQMWEVAIVNGRRDKGTQRERDHVTKSNVKASGTWVPMGCSQEWLLVGRGRWDCPTKVCTILIEGLQGRGE